jgi:hypothetical protein
MVCGKAHIGLVEFFFLMVRWTFCLLSLVGVNVYAVTYERHYVS